MQSTILHTRYFYEIILALDGGDTMESQITFSTLLTQLVDESEDSLRKTALKLQNRLNAQNSSINMSYQTLAAYRNFTSVPSFERAATILDFFNYQIDSQRLTEILDYSRMELKKINEEKDIRQGIRLNPKNFKDNFSATELEIIIKQRINEIYGNENGSINSYVTDLIKNDLISSGYLQ